MSKIIILIGMLCMPVMSVANDEIIKTPISIAIVDTQKLMSESKAAKSIQRQGIALRKKYQNEIGKSKDDFLKKQKTFQESVLDSKKTVAELNQKMDKAVGSALKKLKDEIIDVVEDIADDKEYDMVLSNTNVLVVSDKMDITNRVMKALNSEVSSISVKD
jgi:Skp family chaperone for outer membrane proteins